MNNEKIIKEYMSELGKKSAAKLTPEQRSERAKKANKQKQKNRLLKKKKGV